MWIKTSLGDLVNLAMASRLYLDARNNLQATFNAGDVLILGPGSVSAAAVLTAFQGHQADYFDIVTEARGALPCSGAGTALTGDTAAIPPAVAFTIPGHPAWSTGFWTLTMPVTDTYTIVGAVVSTAVMASAGVAVKFGMVSGEIADINTVEPAGGLKTYNVKNAAGTIVRPSSLVMNLC